jgi:phage tail sheath protein FI
MAIQLQAKTPGVYINEPPSFPPAVVAVETAVPAFIGYTQTAVNKAKKIPLTPIKITSMAEYEAIFGTGYTEKYYLRATNPAKPAGTDHVVGEITLGDDIFDLVEMGSTNFNMYDCLRLFYMNGGADCYVVSVGDYGTPDAPAAIGFDLLNQGLAAIENVVGPTMLVFPDAALLPDINSYGNLAVAALQQCYNRRDRVALLDFWVDQATLPATPTSADLDALVSAYRTALAAATPDQLGYGMAYLPDLVTSVVQTSEISLANLDSADANLATLTRALKEEAGKQYPVTDARFQKLSDYIDQLATQLKPKPPATGPVPPPPEAPPPNTAAAPAVLTTSQLTAALSSAMPAFTRMFQLMAASQNILPPSAAMAGIYTANDAAYGVWNAPANVGIAGAIAPLFPISDHQQEDLNAPINGMALNAIRTFVNRGTLVWGARTLDATSNDWKYIQIRRTMIFIEQSVKDALGRFVFAPNTAQTWVTVVAMIESFLHGIWAAGGLMGASPDQAYGVQCGLGSTMTSDDILAGNMNVHIVLTMVHPAEFIELTFTQQMLTGA